MYSTGFPGGPVVKKKNQPANERDMGSIPDPGRCPGEGNGNPLQCSGLGKPMDRVAWRATVRGDERESDTTVTKQQVYSTRNSAQSPQ